MARGFFSTPMTEDTIVEFGTVMKLLSLMNIKRVRLTDYSRWQAHRRRDPCAGERPYHGLRHFHRKHAG